MMQPEELVAILEGANTAIVADDEYSAATFVCGFTTKELAERSILVIYSEIKCRKVEKVLKSKMIGCEGIKDFIDSIPVVKVGKTNEAGFGEVVAYVEENGDLREICGELGSILKKLNKDGNMAAIFIGFDLVSYVYSPIDILWSMEELLAHVPQMTKYFVLTRLRRECLPLVTNLFDVVIRIKRSKSFDIMAYSRTYDVYVEHSIIKGLPPLPLYRIDGDKMVSIV